MGKYAQYTGPKHGIISICVYKTSCTESRNLLEAKLTEKRVIHIFKWAQLLKSGQKEQISLIMHIPGLGGTLRAHFGSLNPGLSCSGLKMGQETCPTFSILQKQIFPEISQREQLNFLTVSPTMRVWNYGQRRGSFCRWTGQWCHWWEGAQYIFSLERGMI